MPSLADPGFAGREATVTQPSGMFWTWRPVGAVSGARASLRPLPHLREAGGAWGASVGLPARSHAPPALGL